MAQVGMQRGPEAPGREPHIQSYLDRNESAVKELSEQVAQLEQRLSTVLRIEPPEGTDKAEKPKEALPPTAERLRSLLESINSVSAHVESIRTRTEA